MGQKINPTGFRVGVIRDWDAKWYADKDFADYLHEDIEIRNFINKKLQDASVSRIEMLTRFAARSISIRDTEASCSFLLMKFRISMSSCK